jgi:dihydroorotate dehydrogenase electron transfer subunit
MVKVNRVIDEADNIKTLMFSYRFDDDPEPGQFLMAWMPGVDEIPLALSYIVSKKQREYGVTIAKVGPATEHFHSLKEGDSFGIRGPYGKGFEFDNAKKILAVGGGIGMAPLAPAVEAAWSARKNVKVIVGARTESGLLFDFRLTRGKERPDITTDDGSVGRKGFATELAGELLDRKKFDLVIGCGPEPMLVKLVEMCNAREIPVQVSLERYMKCGIGICDSCALSGFHVCKDGPVFEGSLLEKLEDFGKYKRDPTGKKIDI